MAFLEFYLNLVDVFHILLIMDSNFVGYIDIFVGNFHWLYIAAVVEKEIKEFLHVVVCIWIRYMPLSAVQVNDWGLVGILDYLLEASLDVHCIWNDKFLLLWLSILGIFVIWSNTNANFCNLRTATWLPAAEYVKSFVKQDNHTVEEKGKKVKNDCIARFLYQKITIK